MAYEDIDTLARAGAEAFDFADRLVVVTGGAGTLGRGFAAALVTHGARVALLDVADARGRDAEAAVNGVRAGSARFFRCDVGDEASVDAAFDAVVAEMGAFHGLINNHTAPVSEPSVFYAPFERFSLAEWRRQCSITLDGVFLCARAGVARMRAAGAGGSIVSMSSIYGVMAHDRRIYAGAEREGMKINLPPSYAAAKAGVIGLTRWLAAEYAREGIRANAIAPGGVDSGENETFKANYGARVPMGRMAAQTEILAAALFLLGPGSTYVTGQTLMVDGGLSAW